METSCKDEAYNEILSFLDTLEESERPEPYNPVYDEAYLNEKIKKATESWKGVDVDAMLADCRGYDEEKSEKPMNQEGLEEELDRFIASGKSVTVEDCGTYKVSYHDFKKVARHFAEWGYLRAAEEAYNKGFIDGVKEIESKKIDAIRKVIEKRIKVLNECLIKYPENDREWRKGKLSGYWDAYSLLGETIECIMIEL